MTFRPVKVGDCRTLCVEILLGEGVIAVNSERSFRSALRRVNRDTPVLLNSPGGNLAGGLLLGIAFREAGSTVGVAPGGACYSACAYALLGGVNRKVLAGGQFGVHQFSTPGRSSGRALSAREKLENQTAETILRKYARLMGVNPELIGMADRTSHRDIRLLSPKELKRLRVVTGR